MRRTYNYLYWRCYDLLQLTGNFDLPWGAIQLLSIIPSMLFVYWFNYFDLDNNFDSLTQKIIYVGFYGLLLLLNYLLFLKDNKYKNAIREFQNESQIKRITLRFICLIFLGYGIYSLF